MLTLRNKNFLTAIVNTVNDLKEKINTMRK